MLVTLYWVMNRGDRMIYTLTMNAAIDLFIEVDNVEFDAVNRSNYDELQPNGKGVNVSLIMKQLGISTTALGFVGGFTGNYIIDELKKKKINTDFVEVKDNTRVNVFTRVLSKNDEFKLVNKGPRITDSQKEELLVILNKLTKKDMLIISGSLPKGIEPTFLKEVVKLLSENDVKFVLDTSYEIVMELLKYKPYLLKPNIDELQIWTNTNINTQDLMVKTCKELVSQGAQRVLLSLGGEGAIYVDAEEAYFTNAPKGKVVNTACSGDTLLGSFLAKLAQGIEIGEALPFSVAAGSSTAFLPGLTDFSDVEELQRQIKTIKIMEE